MQLLLRNKSHLTCVSGLKMVRHQGIRESKQWDRQRSISTTTDLGENYNH